jgi:predicted O-methyltransferase YrrM
MTTLDAPLLKDLLDRLYADAARTDGVLMPQIRERRRREGLDDRATAPLLEEAYIPVAREVGRLLYQLVRLRRPKLAVEFGTSFALSTLHIAAGLRDNGEGHLITTEQSANKAVRARANISEARLDDIVELREGDAFETLAGVEGIDFLLLDGWKALYLPLLQKLEPALSPGCLIVADDMLLMPQILQPYADHMRDPANGYISTAIPIDDGLEISIKV